MSCRQITSYFHFKSGKYFMTDQEHIIFVLRTLAKHKRIPLSEKPREKPVCPYHTSHVMEFTCLQDECAASPLMCYICKDYGRHKGHQNNLLELEAENVRNRMLGAVHKMKKVMEDMSETNRNLERVLIDIKGNESILGFY